MDANTPIPDANISNTNGKATIKTSIQGKTVRYELDGQIKEYFRNKFTRKNKNNINKSRKLAIATVSLPYSDLTTDLVEKIIANKENEAIIEFNRPVAFLNILTNSWDQNVKNSANKGTFVSNNTKKNSFNESVNLGKKHPEKKLYFLRPGIGTKLIKHIIEHMRGIGIKCLILESANKPLEKYYEKLGFKQFPGNVIMFEANGLTVNYGSGDSGRVMYLLL